MQKTLPDLTALLKSWERNLRAERKSINTIRTYTDSVALYLRWCDQSGIEPELTKANAQRWITALLDKGAEAATARGRLKGLRRFSAWLADEGELDDDPLLGVKPVKVDSKVVPALTDGELRALLKVCQGKTLKDKRDTAIITLMTETGLRAGEVVALQVSDVDLDRGLVVVRRGKGGRGRVVGIRPQAVNSIDRYLRARKAHYLADTGPLWLGVGGKTFGYAGLNAALKQRAKDAGIAGFHAHLLRHTAATRWLRAGGTEQGALAHFGWTSRALLDRYTGYSAAERAAEEARRLDLDL